MSSAPSKSVEYVLAKPVSMYMDRDVLMLGVVTPTREAAHMLRHYERDDVVVVADGEAVGIVTDQDILDKVGDASVYAEATRLRDIMSSPVITIGEDATLREAARAMRDAGVRKLPVTSKKGDVVGMIRVSIIADRIRVAAASQPRVLSPPVKAVLGNLGFVLQFAGALLLIPAIVATLLGDTVVATGIYLTTVLLLVTGFCLNSYGEKAALNMRQASALVFSSLLILVLFGTIPYLYVSPHGAQEPLDAFASGFFSSAAGFTTGGVSLFDAPEEHPQSFTFYRSFTQLVGGMSFIYLVITAFYPENKLHSMRGFISGKMLHMRELFGTITVIFALYILIVTALLHAIGGGDLLDTVSLSMSTLATGGFLPSSTALDGLGWQGHAVLMAAMLLGALPFTFHYGFVRRRFLSAQLGREVMVFFGITGAAALLFSHLAGLDLLSGAFYAVSASTTAGLQPAGLGSLAAPAVSVLILLMFVGGCGFSTAGGVKVFRLMQVGRACLMLRRKGRESMKPEEKKEIATAALILVMFPAVAAMAAVHLSAATGAGLDDSFLEAAGLITTGGLSAGAVTAEADPATLVAFAFMMILGRLEIVAVLYVFLPRLSP